MRSVQRNGDGSFDASEAELAEQLRAWKENPSWVDKPPQIKVRGILRRKFEMPLMFYKLINKVSSIPIRRFLNISEV